MTRKLFTLCFAACILAATSSAPGAESTNAPAQNAEATHRLLPPTGLTAHEPEIPGVAGGGPIGVLTEQQQACYQTAIRAARGQLVELQARLRAARQDLLDTSFSGKFDENLLRQKAMAAARIEAEVAVIRIKALSEVQPPLSPEQIAKIKTGERGLVHPEERQKFERQFRHEPPAVSNGDVNGLPPKQ